MFGYAIFFPINRCPVSVITFWIKEAQSGGIESHTDARKGIRRAPKTAF